MAPDHAIPIGSRAELAEVYRTRFGLRVGRLARYELVRDFAARTAGRMNLSVAQALAMYAPVVDEVRPIVEVVYAGPEGTIQFELAIHPDELWVLADVPVDAN